jgi:hypothetical protein
MPIVRLSPSILRIGAIDHGIRISADQLSPSSLVACCQSASQSELNWFSLPIVASVMSLASVTVKL